MKKRTVSRWSALTVLTAAMIAVTAAFALLLLTPTLIWQFSPYWELNVWAIDKTVPYPDYREHAGFFWILKNEKISKPGAKHLYDEASDYFGFYPYGKNDWRSVALPTSGPRPDLIYITDTYGVYKDDYMQKKLSGELSQKLYGALTAEDIGSIRQNLGAGNIFIAEFNTAASPTNIRDRKILGNLLGVQWNGWIGKYFEDLSAGGEVPAWVFSLYKGESGKKWAFYGRGYVLISENDQVEVLSMADDVGPGGLAIAFTKPWASKLASKKPVSFRNWFEWITPEPGLETAAEYHFDLKPAGAEKLKVLGLPAIFPAAVRQLNSQYTGWYFAGDFADLRAVATPFRMKGIGKLKRLLIDDTVDSNAYFFWKAYLPLMESILKDAKAAKKARAVIAGESGEPKIKVRAFGKGFQMRDREGVWKDFSVRGVNMGLAEPGKYFTEFPDSVSTYLRWVDGIAEMNANTIRIYTLPPPEFYKALFIHNTEKPEKTLFLLQEIWPEENPPKGDYLASAYRESYLKEIDYGIDAIYGRANVPERKGRAWGIYTADVSPWLLGWLVGRELESAEVMATDSRNKGATYSGRYISAGAAASPTEAWLAESLDEVASIEAARYGALHPVAIVSWPTLDPVEHPSEWDPVTGKKNKGNDRASVTIDHFEITPTMTAGLFGAYHIYPDYPDFMNNEAAYGSYRDEKGVLRYGGYLSEFMKSHRRYPALVAEFGLANGSGVAHFAPDGLDHGGHSETEAGEGILRMLEAIKREGYAGGIIFEWMDEWVNKAWTTEFLMVPYDRHVLWHNAIDPEQNYGLMANDVVPSEKPEISYNGGGLISSIGMAADASYLNLTIDLTRPADFQSEEILVGLDTYDRAQGQRGWPVGSLSSPSGMEYLLKIRSTESADLLVLPSYNAAYSRYATSARNDGIFERISLLVNGAVTTKDGRKIPEKRFDASSLRKGDFDEAGNLWKIEGSRISVRLPWTLINVSDPSSLQVIQDKRTDYYNPERDGIKTETTDGFVVQALAWNRKTQSPVGTLKGDPSKPYAWKGWEEAPAYKERYKKSYYIIKEAWAASAAADGIFR
ncbi:MAG: hypothetical protein NT061_03165 [Spirochaetes bacterium]|nr:hypothetical protein [Spirochaetota bacterium]